MRTTKTAVGYNSVHYGRYKRSVALLIPVALWGLQLAPRYTSSFAPVKQFDGSLRTRARTYPGRFSNYGRPGKISSLRASVDESTTSESSQKEISYSAILGAIDKDHYDEATQLCSYLETEATSSTHERSERAKQLDSRRDTYHLPDTPVLSGDAVQALRLAAQSYFEMKRGNNNDVRGIERVDLGELLAPGEDPAWKRNLNDALTQNVYPSVRSGWPHHDALIDGQSTSTHSNQSDLHGSPVLTVTSASVFAGGGHPGAKPAATTFERDAGLFVVHIDLGNEDKIDGHSVMGALFLESLVGTCEMQSNKSMIVGPLSPGQMVVHRSMERTAAISVPSNIHLLERESVPHVDSLWRTHILKAAESSRHYSLRLVLTTTKIIRTEAADGTPIADFPEAPSEERSYRLRSYARFHDDRVRYLTLAGILDVNDYENQLWLGFDYIARMGNPDDNQFDLRQRLSDINKAIFHLEKAVMLCPTDARIHFQLATVIGAKIELEKQMVMDGNEQIEVAELEATGLNQVAKALECSAQLESAAVELGVNGIQDLTICLNALAQNHCRMGNFDKALSFIDQWAECGSIRSALAVEDSRIQLRRMSRHEWITVDNEGKRQNVAVRTVGGMPLFDPEDIDFLRSAADERFALAAGIQTSRYTMQYEGNSEVHLDDLCAGDPFLKARMDMILQERVYPLVRAAFSEEAGSGGDEPPMGPLCVYDSIFVRYNGDTAKAAGRLGASQPLHQDGGIYSVNIALNAHQDDDDKGFTGGGTFLEALTVGNGDHVQRPIAPGHAIIHKTTQRHAGAPTTSGVRDILVIFLTARRPEMANNDEITWGIERAMRLQSIGKELQRDKLIPSLRLARQNDPTNSEVPYWLGVHLIQGDMNDPSDERWEEICEGVESLSMSTLLNPADARAHYHLGMALSARHKYAMRTKRAHLLPSAKEAAESLIKAFETAISLEGKCVQAGCENGINLAAAFLALGDFMGRLKNFDKAIYYLNQVEDTLGQAGDMDKTWAHAMLQEVNSMLDYCKDESAKKNEASLVIR